MRDTFESITHRENTGKGAKSYIISAAIDTDSIKYFESIHPGSCDKLETKHVCTLVDAETIKLQELASSKQSTALLAYFKRASSGNNLEQSSKMFISDKLKLSTESETTEVVVKNSGKSFRNLLYLQVKEFNQVTKFKMLLLCGQCTGCIKI